VSDDFMPGEPTSGSGKYLNMNKLKDMKDRTARIRILCPFITGFERFGADKKPRRWREGEQAPTGVVWGPGFDGKEQAERRFWATAIHHAAADAIQVWQFHQGTIHRQLKELMNNEDWGIPTSYDIKIKSVGEGKDVEYPILPCPKSPLPPEVKKYWDNLKEEWVGLDALFTGDDPFAPFGEKIPF